MRRLWIAVVIAVCAAATVWVGGVASAERTRKLPDDHTPRWQWLHGRAAVQDLARCNRCHTADSCRACHLAEWPHPEGFLKLHGKEAARLKGRGCYLCHRPAYCDPCHQGVRMPHPAGYLGEHAVQGPDRSACVMCHDAKACDACHERHGRHTSEGALR